VGQDRLTLSSAHVAGLVAYLVSREGNKPPAEVAARLVELGVKDKITGVPEGTVNLLARNDI
jgi:cerevisin